MNNGKICVSVCSENAAELVSRIKEAEQFADVIEVRFDCVEPQNIPDIFTALDSTKPLLLTFRPKEQGGNADLDLHGRIGFWTSFGTDGLTDSKKVWFDNEADLVNILQQPAERTVIRSLHDFSGVPDELDMIFDELSAKEEVVKIACSISEITEGIPIWRLLEKASTQHKQFIPIAMGEAGKWTRILGLAHGAFMTYASLDSGNATAPGQISVWDMTDIYRVKELDEDTGVYGIIGGNTSYSVSPFMHNAAFKSEGINSVFVPLQVGDLDEFMRRMVKPESREVELNFKGFSVTNPHKQSIIRHLDFVDETATRIGAVNTVKIEDGKFCGYNTDAPGFIEPLKNLFGELKDARVAVFGAGGAARACIYALKQHGADVFLFARDPQKARSISDEFDVPLHRLAADNVPLAFDIIVNATPLGTVGIFENETIATAEQLRGVKLVYDLIYNPSETRLMHEANSVNVSTIGGLEMLVAQGSRQFRIWTGLEAPLQAMSDGVRKKTRSIKKDCMEAEALNCPNCGGAVASDKTQCEFCKSRLKTVGCNSCLGLMFLGSAFCGHCGKKAVAAEVFPNDEAGKCPRCEIDLQAVQIDATTIRECTRCGGLWSGIEAFEDLCANKEQQAAILNFIGNGSER